MFNIIITGSNKGLGLGLVRELLQGPYRDQVATLTATARNPEQATALQQLKKEQPKLRVFQLDVGDEISVQAFAKAWGSQLGVPIDLLINNAGILLDSEKTSLSLDLENVRKSFETNTIGPMRMAKALEPYLSLAKQAKVVHISSMMGSIGDNTSGAYYGYRMSKAALNMFHKSYSIEFKKRVSLVLHPGWVKTDMGGAQAPTEISDSCRGMAKVIFEADLKDSGSFLDFRGKKLPW